MGYGCGCVGGGLIFFFFFSSHGLWLPHGGCCWWSGGGGCVWLKGFHGGYIFFYFNELFVKR